MKKTYILIYIIVFSMFMTGCKGPETELVFNYHVPSVESPKAVLKTEQVNGIEHQIKKATLTVVGDIMFHEYQLRRSYDAATNTFDFDDSFQYVAHYLDKADLTIGNLETTLAGANNARNFSVDKWVAGYSGYPCFNTPDVAAQTIKKVGFDLLTTANNHSLDSGVAGLKRTLDVLDENEILHVGTYRTKEEAEELLIVDVNGIEIAFISFTYGMNGFTAPQDEPYIINSVDMYLPEKEEEICNLVRNAYEQKPDIIIVMAHYGNEYVEYENSYQRNLTDKLLKAGADIVLGSHPHVLQPIDYKEVTREDGTVANCFVIYSLGNFISSQKYDGAHKDLGIILNLQLEKIDFQNAKITGFSLIPTYTYWSNETIGVLPVDETLDKINKGQISFPTYDVNRLKFANNYSVNHLLKYLEGYTYTYNDYCYHIPLVD